jgi:hypothetical protein
MKVYKLTGKCHPLSLTKESYCVFLIAPKRMMETKFRVLCKSIVEELKVKYDADNPDIKMVDCKSRETIIDELSEILCKQHGFKISKIEVLGEYIITGFLD